MNKVKNQALAIKLSLLAVLLWSSVATAFKVALRTLTPEVLLIVSIFVSTFVLGLYCFIFKREEILKLRPIHIKRSALYGFINPFVYYFTLFKAYELLPAQEAQAINYTWSIVLTFLTCFILKQKITRKYIIAASVSYFGILIISTKGDIFSLQFSNNLGLFFGLMSTFFWALYWALNTADNIDQSVRTFLNFLLSIPYLFVFMYFSDISIDLNSYELLACSYIGLFEMSFTFLLWGASLKMASDISQVSNFIFISPIISLILINFVLGEQVIPSTIVGVVFILLGISYQNFKK